MWCRTLLQAFHTQISSHFQIHIGHIELGMKRWNQLCGRKKMLAFVSDIQALNPSLKVYDMCKIMSQKLNFLTCDIN